MSEDFARAVTEGRYPIWKEQIPNVDREFVQRLRLGQYDSMDGPTQRELKLGTQRPFGPSTEKVDTGEKTSMEEFKLVSLAVLFMIK